MKYRDYVFGYSLSAVTLILSVPLFFFCLDIAISYIKIYRGLPAFAALFSTIPLGIGAMAFIIFVVNYYTERSGKGDLPGRFFVITSIQMFLFPFLGLVRFLVYIPMLRAARAPVYTFWGMGPVLSLVNFLKNIPALRSANFSDRFWQLVNLAIVGGGAALGALFVFLAYRYSKSSRKEEIAD
ncbi:MAG: hypothetical protein ACUVXI_05940 [bacterium]